MTVRANEPTPGSDPHPLAPPTRLTVDGIGGRTVLVTGGGSGLGAATAHVLAAAGMCVAVADLLPETAEATAASIRDGGGQRYRRRSRCSVGR